MMVPTLASDLATQIRGVSYSKGEAVASPRPGYVALIRANNITDSGLNTDGVIYVPESRVGPKQKLQVGDIVIAASSGSLDVVGKAACVRRPIDATFGAFCKVVRPSPHVHSLYLSAFFQTAKYRSIISSLAAGANINNLRNEHIDNLEIPLPHKNGKPDLEEQKRIAAILDKADAIRRKRQQALRLTDDFLRSDFLEMFGDPITNPKGWKTAPASEVFESFRYGTSAKCSEVRLSDDQLPVLRIPNVAEEKINWDDLKYGGIPQAELERLRLQRGDILFVRTNGNPELIGRCAMFQGKRDAVYASYLIRGRIPDDSGSRPSFVHSLLCTDRLRAEIRQMATTSAGNYNINAKSLGSIPIIQPPLALQDDFIRIKEQVVFERQNLVTFEMDSDHLFSSLQQRAFRGEL